MFQDRGYELHKEYMNSIIHFDLESINKIGEERVLIGEQIELCNQKILAMRVMTNRIEAFSAALDVMLNNDEITNNDFAKILEFVNKKSMYERSISRLIDGFGFKMFINRMNIPDTKKQDLLKIMKNTAIMIDQKEEQLTLDSFGNNEFMRNEYQSLKNELTECERMLQENSKHESELIASMLEVYQSGNISNIQEMNNLCDQMENKNIEILLIGPDDTDPDLAAVIQMKAKNAVDNGNELIILSFEQFKEMINSNDINRINKLSFLHHGKLEFGYVNEIDKFINHMPDLKEVVLRGCGTAYASKKSPETNYQVKMSNIPFDKTPSIQGETSLILQQKEVDGEIYTKATWATMDVNQNRSLKHVDNITGVSKVHGKSPTDAQLQELARVKGIPLLKHRDAYINSARQTFFNTENSVTKSEIANAKKVLRRARTESIASSDNDLLSEVLGKMTPEQRQRISVKAYVGGYEVRHGRVIPFDDHDQMRLPKAVRIGPEFNRKDGLDGVKHSRKQQDTVSDNDQSNQSPTQLKK